MNNNIKRVCVIERLKGAKMALAPTNCVIKPKRRWYSHQSNVTAFLRAKRAVGLPSKAIVPAPAGRDGSAGIEQPFRKRLAKITTTTRNPFHLGSMGQWTLRELNPRSPDCQPSVIPLD